MAVYGPERLCGCLSSCEVVTVYDPGMCMGLSMVLTQRCI